MSDIAKVCGGKCDFNTSYINSLNQYTSLQSQSPKKVNDILKQMNLNRTISDENFIKENYINAKKGLYDMPGPLYSNSKNPGPNYETQQTIVPLYAMTK